MIYTLVIIFLIWVAVCAIGLLWAVFHCLKDIEQTISSLFPLSCISETDKELKEKDNE